MVLLNQRLLYILQGQYNDIAPSHLLLFPNIVGLQKGNPLVEPNLSPLRQPEGKKGEIAIWQLLVCFQKGFLKGGRLIKKAV